MAAFKQLSTGLISHAEPGTKLHAIYSRSVRWEAVDEDAVPEEPLAAFSIAQLKAAADTYGVEMPGDVRKSRAVEIVRDAGITPEQVVASQEG